MIREKSRYLTFSFLVSVSIISLETYAASQKIPGTWVPTKYTNSGIIKKIFKAKP
jgi:hypothetical protein